MRVDSVVGSALAIVLAFTAGAHADPQSKDAVNAALRYWMAFAELQEPALDRATSELLESVADGQAPWDERRLGIVLDANESALRVMRRATRLSVCDWGLEYELGPSTPIAHLPKARVLGRLAVLAGVRAEASGRSQEAIDIWLSGVRFSAHVAEGGSLASVLSAKAILDANLRALTSAASRRRLDRQDADRIAAAMRSLPRAAFDWSAALRREADAVVVMVHQLAGSPEPAAEYRRLLGTDAPAPFVLPTAAQVHSYQAFMNEVANAFQLAPEITQGRLSGYPARTLALPPLLRDSVPSFSRLNGARVTVEGQRTRLLQIIGQTHPG